MLWVKKRHKWHCCKCILVPLYNQGFFKTVIFSLQRLISVLRDAWELGSPFLYLSCFIINLSPSSPVNKILVKLNLIFLCPLHGRHPVAQLLQPSGAISTSSVSILKGNGLYTWYLHVFFMCSLDCDCVVVRHHCWATKIISFLSFEEKKTFFHGPQHPCEEKCLDYYNNNYNNYHLNPIA